ncbi:MAG TPA: SMI1/KNR4 family protein [Terracidiphilus sp.]|jgi:hypothetical protein
MLSVEFLEAFKHETEMRWREKLSDPRIYGFQFQAGTRWCPGLSNEQISAYENDINIQFPADLKTLLRSMNGTDLPTLNIFGSSGEPSRHWVGVYSYPRDLALIRQCISEASRNPITLRATLAEEGLVLSETAKFMPIYAHRFVVCDGAERNCPVLSIWSPEDAIIFGNMLREYLEREFLGKDPN